MSISYSEKMGTKRFPCFSLKLPFIHISLIFTPGYLNPSLDKCLTAEATWSGGNYMGLGARHIRLSPNSYRRTSDKFT